LIEAIGVIAVIFARIVITVLPIALRMIVTRTTEVETMIVAVPVRSIIATIVHPFPLIVVMTTAQIETIILAEIIIVMTIVIAVQVVTRIAAVIQTEAPVTIIVPVDIPHILQNPHTFLKLPCISTSTNLIPRRYLSLCNLLPHNLLPSQLQLLQIPLIPNDYLLPLLIPLALTSFSTTTVAYMPSTKIKKQKQKQKQMQKRKFPHISITFIYYRLRRLPIYV